MRCEKEFVHTSIATQVYLGKGARLLIRVGTGKPLIRLFSFDVPWVTFYGKNLARHCIKSNKLCRQDHTSLILQQEQLIPSLKLLVKHT